MFNVLYKEWLSDQATDRIIKEQSFAYSQDVGRIARGRKASLRREPFELSLSEILIQISSSATKTQGATQGKAWSPHDERYPICVVFWKEREFYAG